MSVILVAEQDASDAQQIATALQSAGWQVETADSRAAALRSAAASRPSLLLVNAGFPEAPQLLKAFSRSQGGPGSLVLVPPAIAAGGAVAELGGDATLPLPCSGEVLRKTVQQCLELPAKTPKPAKRSSRQLTSADIFGDVLAEVEAEAEQARRARRARSRSARNQSEDLERRLEETLSGVLSVDEMRKRSARRQTPPAAPAPADRSAESEVDALLDETLSALQMSPRPEPAPRPEAEPAQPPGPPQDRQELGSAPEPTSPPQVDPAPVTADPGSPDPALQVPEIVVPEMPIPDLPPPETSPPPFEALGSGSSDAGPVGPPEPRFPPPSAPELPTEAGPADLGIEIFKTQPLPIVVAGDAAVDDAPGVDAPGVDAPGVYAPGVDVPGVDARTSRPPAAPSPAETEGIVFGDYTLLDRIAIGGMAEVWRARRRGVEGFQKTVAIKKILAHLTSSSDFVNMFIDEAKLAAQLNHHNIIQIYDLGKVDEDFFIAMEYVEGKDLRSILAAAKERRRPVPIGLSLLIVSAVARALHYAHRKRDFDDRDLGLVHRDVSPQNVLISHEGEIKLCDFGIVKAVSKASNTQMGALKGKLQYMSPEQAWGKSVDARSDIFSLGSVFFELLTGEKLFTGDSEISVLDAVRECLVRSPREIVPQIPPEVESIVLKALAKDPEARYQTAGDLEHGIQAVLDRLSPTPVLKDLASYLYNLFGSRAPATVEPPAALEPPILEAPPPGEERVEALPARPSPAETAPDVTPPAKPRVGKGFRSLLAAAVLAGVLVAAGFLALRDTGNPPPEEPLATGPEEAELAAPDDGATEPPQETAAGELPAADDAGGGSPAAGGAGTTATADQTPDGRTPDGRTPDPQDPEAGATASAPLPADLQQLVESAVSEKKEQITKELERDFEAQKRRLQEEIAKAQDEAKPPPGDGEEEDGGGAS